MAALYAFLRWLTGSLSGKLLDAYRIKLESGNETERILADVAIKDLEAQIAARESAKEVRLSTSGFLEMRVITALIALPFVIHLWAVMLDTVFQFGWRIPKFPSPFDQYEGTILLSFFGVQAVGIGVTAIAAAIRGRK